MSSRASHPEPVFPERIGRYEILLPIASGGMATVYLARSRGLGGFERDVAVKLTHAHLQATPEFATELVEEAKLAVRIRHMNVVQVLDVGEDPSGLFLVMDYVEGDTLSGLMRRSAKAGAPLPPFIGLRILVDALAGLHAAHELKDDEGRPLHLVHRDFSPQNILVGLDGVSRLADFGVAKAASRLSQTQIGGIKGKIAYMSPEQARARPLDRRCDVWAAGVVAWELLTGRRLFYGAEGDEVAMLLRIATQVPPRLRTFNPNVPASLDDAVASALTPDPAKRCPSAAAFERALLDGCKAAGIELARSSDVARTVEALTGANLAERRRKAKQIFQLRAQVSSLASADGIATPASVAGVAHLVPPELADAASTLDLPARPAVRTLELPSPRPPELAPRSSATTTSTTSVSLERGRGLAPRTAARAWAAAGFGALLVALGLAWFGLRHYADDAAPVASPAPSASSTLAAGVDSAPESPSASAAPAPLAPSNASALPAPSASASATAAPATTASARVGEPKRVALPAPAAPPAAKTATVKKKEEDRIGF